MVPETYLPVTLFVPDISDAQFQEFCEQYADFRLEYTAEGELIIMPPTDAETGYRNATITASLFNWSRIAGTGRVTDSSAGFALPNGARLSPDAAWSSLERFARHACPEFVIELLSPFDRPKVTRAKMHEWTQNGAELAWMIAPATRTVTVFRPGREPQEQAGLDSITGEGPVAGFVLNLRDIWAI